jgi:putative redox protein
MNAKQDAKGVPPSEAGTVVVTETGDGLAQYLLDGRHRLLADEPVAAGGEDIGPGPYELLLMALGACTSITLRLYANRKQWPLERVTVQLGHARNHVEDCIACETKPVRLDHIDCAITLEGVLDEGQRARLLAIADGCPIHRSLTTGIAITTRLAATAR